MSNDVKSEDVVAETFVGGGGVRSLAAQPVEPTASSLTEAEAEIRKGQAAIEKAARAIPAANLPPAETVLEEATPVTSPLLSVDNTWETCGKLKLKYQGMNFGFHGAQSWSELDSILRAELEGDEGFHEIFASELVRAMESPHFEAYRRQYFSNPLNTDVDHDYVWACPDGDPVEDLLDFLRWSAATGIVDTSAQVAASLRVTDTAEAFAAAGAEKAGSFLKKKQKKAIILNIAFDL